MRRAIAVGLTLLLLMLPACGGKPVAGTGDSRPPEPQTAPKQPASAPAEPPAQPRPVPADEPAKTVSPPRSPEVGARFRLFQGPAVRSLADAGEDLTPGQTAAIWVGPAVLEITHPALTRENYRDAVLLKGADPAREMGFVQGRGVSIRLGPGKPGESLEVSVRPPGGLPLALVLRRTQSASVAVEQRSADGWKPVGLLNATAPAGPAQLRLSFSKPVRTQDVEKALSTAQKAPVRGTFYWEDESTLVWSIAQMPARVDLALGEARDRDGVPLPGGLPSLRVGEGPALVEVDLATAMDLVRIPVPPDILDASLTRDRTQLNLRAWVPGSTPWDWQSGEWHVALADGILKPGREERAQPRIPDDLEDWVMSPQGTAVAGLRTQKANPADPAPIWADLAVVDLNGGRQAVFPRFIGRHLANTSVDLTTHLAWSEDGQTVAALSYDGNEDSATLVGLHLPTGKLAVLARNLPVPARAVRLAWSPNGRFILAGNVLVNLTAGTSIKLEGAHAESRGAWEPDGARLLYSVQDWGSVFVVDAAAGEVKPLGTGYAVGWAAPGKVYVIRWPASGTRYEPPGE